MVAGLLGGVVKLKPQTLRVLRVLEQRSVTIADFDCQPACDGGDRITRLGARVHELKRAGFPVHGVRVKLGTTHVQRYTLVTEPGEVMPNRANSAAQGISVRGRDHQVRGAGCARAENADDLAWIQGASRWIHNRPALQQVSSSSSPAYTSAGDARHGAHRDGATPRDGHETSGTAASSTSVAARPSLPAGVVPVKAHTRRIHPEPAGPTLFDAATFAPSHWTEAA